MKEIIKRSIKNFDIEDFTHPQPSTLNVEVTNICNLSCIMCPASSVKRPRGMMKIELFKDVLDEAVEMGINQVGLHTVGESILHPEIEKFIQLSKSKNIYTYMDVNGNNFREGLHEAIIDSGLDSLKFSIDGHTQQIYSKIRRGGNLEKVFSNLKKMDFLRKQKKSKMKLYALYIICKENEQYVEAFKKMFAPYVDEIEISCILNQGEQVEGYEGLCSPKLTDIMARRRKMNVCPNPFKRINISWDGYLTACCIDFELNLVYGKFEKGKLKELWNNEKIKLIRKKIQTFNLTDLKLCKNCDLIFNDIAGIMEEINKLY